MICNGTVESSKCSELMMDGKCNMDCHNPVYIVVSDEETFVKTCQINNKQELQDYLRLENSYDIKWVWGVYPILDVAEEVVLHIHEIFNN